MFAIVEKKKKKKYENVYFNSKRLFQASRVS